MSGKLKFTFHFRNGSIMEKIIEVSERNATIIQEIVEAIKCGFRDGTSFQISLETMIIRGDDLIAVEFEEV